MRRPKPFFRTQTQSWYVQLDGKQHKLGCDEAEAWARYDQLMANRPKPSDKPAASTAVGLLIGFLEWCKRHKKPKTYVWYKGFLDPFARHLVKAIGEHAPADAVKAHHLTTWLDAKGFDVTTRCGAISAVKRAFNWAVEEDYILASPLKKVKRGKRKRRETIISPEQWAAIVASVSPDDPFADFLTFVRETGCRPQEARAAQVRHLDAAAGLIYLPADEAKGELPRNIYLNDTALAVVVRLAEHHKSGYLFRSTKGKPWGVHGIISRFRRLRETLGIKGLSAYVTRHTFATEALQRGLDSVIVAELMGHKDHTMVAKTYQHLAKNPQFLREAARKATE